MFRYSSCSRAFALALLLVAVSAVDALAHCFVGQRFLPATLATDDPCVADEMSIPTVSWTKTADAPPANSLDVSVDFAKRITEDFGITLRENWSHVSQTGSPPHSGFNDFESTFQYQLLKDGP